MSGETFGKGGDGFLLPLNTFRNLANDIYLLNNECYHNASDPFGDIVQIITLIFKYYDSTRKLDTNKQQQHKPQADIQFSCGCLLLYA